MNPLIRLLLLCAMVGGGAWYGFTAYNKLKVLKEHELDLSRIQKDFLERASWVNVVPDPEKYRTERDTLDKWYFTQLSDHYNKYPTFKNYTKAQDEILKGGGKGDKNKDTANLKQAYYDLTKGAWEALKAGTYNPVFSQQSNGLRFDIFKVAKVNSKEGPKVRLDMMVWGAQRQMQKDTSATGSTVSKMITQAKFEGINFAFFDAKDKRLAEMNVSGPPEIEVEYPERWIEEFPPQAVIGFYELDPIPPEPVKMEMVVTINSRSPSGVEIPGIFKFTVPIEAEWKLAPGETWKGATTEERPKEYLDGKAPKE